jgi:hypothetical protein|nr:MAG: hypothetical protein [Microviridae sp.]
MKQEVKMKLWEWKAQFRKWRYKRKQRKMTANYAYKHQKRYRGK